MFYSAIVIIGCKVKISIFIRVADPGGVDPDPKLSVKRKLDPAPALEKPPGV